MLRGIANQRDGWKYFIQEKFVFNVFKIPQHDHSSNQWGKEEAKRRGSVWCGW